MYLLAKITIIPRSTILKADLAADCLRAFPRKAPSITRSRMPIDMEMLIEYPVGMRRSGNRRIRDARADVKAVTIAETTALLLILPSRRWTFG